jgi:hypothetical protein
MRMVPGSQEDDTGQRCPFFAHIRKVNPRDIFTDRGNAGVTLTFQMLRRGIPYGPVFEEVQNEQADRGLLFLAYQTSITNQFQSLNKGWMNNPSAPDRIVNAGYDMVVGQNPSPSGSRFCSFRDAAHTEIARLETLARWVIPTGGAFLFSPSISFFRSI